MWLYYKYHPPDRTFSTLGGRQPQLFLANHLLAEGVSRHWVHQPLQEAVFFHEKY